MSEERETWNSVLFVMKYNIKVVQTISAIKWLDFYILYVTECTNICVGILMYFIFQFCCIKNIWSCCSHSLHGWKFYEELVSSDMSVKTKNILSDKYEVHYCKIIQESTNTLFHADPVPASLQEFNFILL